MNTIFFVHIMQRSSENSILDSLRELLFQNFLIFAPNYKGCCTAALTISADHFVIFNSYHLKPPIQHRLVSCYVSLLMAFYLWLPKSKISDSSPLPPLNEFSTNSQLLLLLSSQNPPPPTISQHREHEDNYMHSLVYSFLIFPVRDEHHVPSQHKKQLHLQQTTGI